MNFGYRNGRFRLDTERTTYFNDSLLGFLADCLRALRRWIGGV